MFKTTYSKKNATKNFKPYQEYQENVNSVVAYHASYRNANF